jgi:CRISPR type I-E-associated protein CasA/Cse1
VVNFMVMGSSLFETLMFNLAAPNIFETCGFVNRAEDRPAWEMEDPYLADPARPYGYMDYLTWHNRKVQLIPEDGSVRKMRYHVGLRFPENLQNPLAHFFLSEKTGDRPMRFSDWRSLWRDSTVLYEGGANSQKNRIPAPLAWMQQLKADHTLKKSQVYRLAAFGMATEPGKDKVYFIRQEQLPLPEAYLDGSAEAGKLLAAEETLAEDMGKQLWGTLKGLAVLVLTNSEDKKPDEADGLVQHWGAERRFWSELEAPFERLVVDLTVDPEAAAISWRESIRGAARAAFDQAGTAIGNSPRAWKALAIARGRLAFALNRVIPESKEEVIQ